MLTKKIYKIFEKYLIILWVNARSHHSYITVCNSRVSMPCNYNSVYYQWNLETETLLRSRSFTVLKTEVITNKGWFWNCKILARKRRDFHVKMKIPRQSCTLDSRASVVLGFSLLSSLLFKFNFSSCRMFNLVTLCRQLYDHSVSYSLKQTKNCICCGTLLFPLLQLIKWYHVLRPTVSCQIQFYCFQR